MKDKPKGHYPQRRLIFVLIGFLFGTAYSANYPLIWFAPPYLALTPVLYLVLSLAWVPLVWRRRHRLNRLLIGLIVGCLIATSVMVYHQHEEFFQYNDRLDIGCTEQPNYICGIDLDGCHAQIFDFIVLKPSPVMLMTSWGTFDCLVLF